MATRRKTSRRSRGRKLGGSIGKSALKIANIVASPIAFLDQISAKDRQVLGNNFTNAPTTQKLKILSNIVTGRISGVNFFSDEYQASQTINPAGIFNKWTGIGAGMIAYGAIARSVNKSLGTSILPATGQIKGIGKKVLIGGAVGGVFDDQVGSTSNTGTRHITLQQSGNLLAPRAQSSSDSTESGL
jgi:hypothetical protein